MDPSLVDAAFLPEEDCSPSSERLKLNAYTVRSPEDDPVLRKQTDAVNLWSKAMLNLLVNEKFPPEQFSLEEASIFCAIGLPGFEDLDMKKSLNKFVDWCDYLRKNERHMLPFYSENPDYAHLTLAQFKVMAMISGLHKVLGVSYDMSIPQDGYFDHRDARSFFIPGLLKGHGGMCVSLPTLVTALGRRLDYPLYLVEAKMHCFVRWNDPSTGERFNFDAAGRGFAARDDEYYKTWPLPLTEQDFKNHPRFLKNLTRRQEIALMIQQRAHCLLDNLRFPEGQNAYEYANAFDPNNSLIESNWKIFLVVARACEASAAAARHEGRSHYPLFQVRLQPIQDKWERGAQKPAREILNDLLKLHGKDHQVRVA
jgi:hypothetical protein